MGLAALLIDGDHLKQRRKRRQQFEPPKTNQQGHPLSNGEAKPSPSGVDAQAERDRMQRQKYEQAMAEKRAANAETKYEQMQRAKYEQAMAEKRARKP